ncbi:acetylglutamate kinase [Paenibacillus sp. UMB4589-SE434]|uniref:acetylglutamate kinase n=1 Tax=Paenibacillus sp. UMB4589-SE434 TaxID=3046314 RepID=UPI00254B125F|nr:acetylglutamate kinase [Paenibacillus sp. UMB4589-SE434]MDK8183926.1 acetylglutamate kinase [Paenibacillus sp. UMB4589-SE434]
MYYYYPRYYHYDFRQVPLAWTPTSVALNQQLRALWEQHVYWTRLAVNSIVGRQPDEKETIARLLRNPDDFAAALKPLYGPAAANKFAELFGEHLTIAAELVKALQAGNTSAAADAKQRWYANADDIAEFLGTINPYWSKEEWRKMLYEHLELLSSEVSSRLAGKYAENIAIGDQIQLQALEMADMMTSGIVQQFPMAFTH